MLLTKMVSDEKGHLFGSIEGDSKAASLSVPHPDAAAGVAKWEDGIDLAMASARNQLETRARMDTGNYYYIDDGHHEEGKRIYVIPYVVFYR